MKKNNKHFWGDGLSVHETRVSALVICLFISFLWAFITHFKFGTVDPNIVDVINTLVLAITGINVVNSLSIPKANRQSNMENSIEDSTDNINNG